MSTKTAADYMTQGILWLQTQEDKGPLISVLLCWLMQTKCRSGSQTAHTDGANVDQREVVLFDERTAPWVRARTRSHARYPSALPADEADVREDTPATRRYWRNANLPFDAWLNYCLSAVPGFSARRWCVPGQQAPQDRQATVP